MKQIRRDVKKGLEKQRKCEMFLSSNAQKPEINQNVRVQIPEIDKFKTDSKWCLLAVVTDIKDEKW